MGSLSPRAALAKAVTLLGGQNATARALGVAQSAVSYWCARGRISAAYAIPMERACGERVMRAQLRPDIYPPADYQQKSRRSRTKSRKPRRQGRQAEAAL